jgi:small multidrug resistance pump
MSHFLLALAIVSEVTGTLALKFTHGFTRALPSLVVVASYMLAFFLLSLVLARGMPVGVAYGIWSACGVTLVATVGVIFLGDNLTLMQWSGIALVGAGVLALEMGAAH